MSEDWRPIPDSPGYDVSDVGRVRSWRNNRWGIGDQAKILKPQLHNGYLIVRLHHKGRMRTKTIHGLVALAFIGPRPDGLETRHWDGEKLNNRIENLVYGTREENWEDRFRHGVGQRTHCKRGHELTDENTYPQTRGGRGCKPCKRAANREYLRRTRLKAEAA